MGRKSRTDLLMTSGRKKRGFHAKEQCADVMSCPVHCPANRR